MGNPSFGRRMDGMKMPEMQYRNQGEISKLRAPRLGAFFILGKEHDNPADSCMKLYQPGLYSRS